MGSRLHKGESHTSGRWSSSGPTIQNGMQLKTCSMISDFRLVGLKSLEMERETMDKERLLQVQFEEALRKDIHPDTTSFMESVSQKAHTFSSNVTVM